MGYAGFLTQSAAVEAARKAARALGADCGFPVECLEPLADAPSPPLGRVLYAGQVVRVRRGCGQGVWEDKRLRLLNRYARTTPDEPFMWQAMLLENINPTLTAGAHVAFAEDVLAPIDELDAVAEPAKPRKLRVKWTAERESAAQLDEATKKAIGKIARDSYSVRPPVYMPPKIAEKTKQELADTARRLAPLDRWLAGFMRDIGVTDVAAVVQTIPRCGLDRRTERYCRRCKTTVGTDVGTRFERTLKHGFGCDAAAYLKEPTFSW